MHRLFQHTAARRRLVRIGAMGFPFMLFQHTAARRRLVKSSIPFFSLYLVSTHSRPKAAGFVSTIRRASESCFNTQPPEGGWFRQVLEKLVNVCFNTQPPEGGWENPKINISLFTIVSTHSRPKAAGAGQRQAIQDQIVSTHSRPKAAGCRDASSLEYHDCFNTQPPEGGWKIQRQHFPKLTVFQHTAARRRLGRQRHQTPPDCIGFNTQPPEGGWESLRTIAKKINEFQHTAARRRLDFKYRSASSIVVLQHTAAVWGVYCGFMYSVFLACLQHTAAVWGLAAAAVSSVSLVLFQHTAARRRLVRQVSTLSLNYTSFNTQPPEGGWGGAFPICEKLQVSTHSRPKAAGLPRGERRRRQKVSTHSRPKAAGFFSFNTQPNGLFQHTAARRRLVKPLIKAPLNLPVSTHSRPKAAGTGNFWADCIGQVSTHSRPKAAGKGRWVCVNRWGSFNTQPPEGGWSSNKLTRTPYLSFQHTAARRRLGLLLIR